MSALELDNVKKFPPPMSVMTTQSFLPVWLAADGRETVWPLLVKKTLSVELFGMV
jgi:hypothetical protein